MRRVRIAVSVLVLGVTAGVSAAPPGKPAPPRAGATDVKLEAAVVSACRRGALWVLAQQVHDGSWRYGDEYGVALTGLAIWTCIRTGTDPSSPVLAKAFEFLAHAPEPATTWDATLRLLAVAHDAKRSWIPCCVERDGLATADSNLPPINPSRRRVADLAMAFLLRTRNPITSRSDRARVAKAESSSSGLVIGSAPGGWGYPSHRWPSPSLPPREVADGVEPVGDIINTTAALLGLSAASDLGMPSPPEVWTSAAELLLSWQEARPGAPAPPTGGLQSPGVDPGRRASPRGFGYGALTVGEIGSVSRCRTASGLAGLELCRRRFSANSTDERLGRIDGGIASAREWIAAQAAAKTSVTAPGQAWNTLHFFALFSAIGRARPKSVGAEVRVPDWIPELLRKQLDSGAFAQGDLILSCAALLALSSRVEATDFPTVTPSDRPPPTDSKK